MTETCEICTDSINRSTRQGVGCPRCEKVACTRCVERYLMESMMDAHCMFCRELWDPIFLRRKLSARFMNETYKKHREDMLWEQQRARLPETMPLINTTLDIEGMYNTVYELQAQLKVIQGRLNETYSAIHRRENQYRRMLRRVNQGDPAVLPREEENTDTETESSEGHYRRGCSKEECPGYIHSRSGHCGSCQTHTCVQCNVHLGTSPQQQHECRQEDVDQWKFIQETSRPCPGCRIRITKESGCDQMWCPNCRTAFRWSTGTIERGTVHNPHYYEWLFQQGGRDQDDTEAGAGRCYAPGELAPRAARLVHRRTDGPDNAVQYDAEFLTLHREVMHNVNVALPRLGWNIGTQRKRNEMYTQLRISYLQKKLSLVDLKTRLQRVDKAHRKTVEYNRICETYIHISVDLLDRFVLDNQMTKKQVIQDIKAVKDIAVKAVEDLNAVYKSRLHLI